MTIMKIKKSELTFDKGDIYTSDGILVKLIPYLLEDQFNLLERSYQRALYGKSVTNTKRAEPFVPESFKFDVSDYLIDKPETPLHDEKEKNALALMEEADNVAVVKNINDYLLNNPQLVEFIHSDDVFVTEVELAEPGVYIDTPKIGNPLELTWDKLLEILHTINDVYYIEDE